MEQKKIVLLGSTGSIGTQTLQVAQHLDSVRILAVAANRNITLLEQQIRRFHPVLCAVYDESAAKDLRTRVQDTTVRVVSGMDGLMEAAVLPEADMVVAAMVGSIGLKPVLAAIRSGKDIALANKETLVTAGSIVMREIADNSVRILPVDSEHSAIFQCLHAIGSKNTSADTRADGNAGRDERTVKRILLTASGGPFYGKSREELQTVTVEQALRHPNWDMGGKITIDSATLMNKGLEVIEAKWLFDVKPEQIEVVVHRESIVHSMVEFCDNSVIAQMGIPDMRIPIQLALTYPKRLESVVPAVDFTNYPSLTFGQPDCETFRCLALAYSALHTGGTMPAAMNAANEAAVDAFLRGRLSFLGIAELVGEAMNAHRPVESPTLDDIFETDRWAREFLLKKHPGLRGIG